MLQRLSVIDRVRVYSRQRVAKYGLVAIGEVFSERLEPGNAKEGSELATEIKHACSGDVVFSGQARQRHQRDWKKLTT